MNRTKVMNAIFAAALGIGMLCSRAAADGPTDSIDLWKVKDNFKTMIGISEKGGAGSREQLFLLIDQTLHLLRGPLPGGAYTFAKVDRSDKKESLELLSQKIDAVVDSGQFQKISAEVATAHQLELYTPTQRGFFKNNGDVFVKSYTVELIIDGVKKTVQREVNDWVRRGKGIPIPLPGLAQWAKIEVNAAVAKTDVNHAYLKILARVPDITDDPRNPYSFSIKELISASQYNAFDSKRKTVQEKLKSASAGLDYVPSVSGAPAETPLDKADLTQRLEYISFLLDSKKDTDKVEAKKAVEELLKLLKK